MSEFRLPSSDGTVLQVWANDAEGIPLLICNGLAASPASWPSLMPPDCGFAARTWYHRGVPPSQTPALDRLTMDHHVDDALAVVADAGWDRYLVVGWSLGVNVALELAVRDPRVAGVLALAGLPGGTFDAMLTGMPRSVSRAVVWTMTRTMTRAGHLLTPLSALAARTNLPADLLRAAGIVGRTAETAHVRGMVRDFLAMDVTWYGRLASALRDHGPMDTSAVPCPVVYVSAVRDLVTDPRAVEAAAEATPGSQVQRWDDASHYLVVEHPERVLAALHCLARQSGMAGDRT